MEENFSGAIGGIMKKLIFVFLAVVMAQSTFAQQGNFCRTYDRESFTLEGRETGVEKVFSCPRDINAYPYFSQINYLTQQGLRCNGQLGITSVYLTCRNRSRQPRSARRVTITCCHHQVHGL
jgi:hypothetical protein